MITLNKKSTTNNNNTKKLIALQFYNFHLSLKNKIYKNIKYLTRNKKIPFK